MKQQKALHLEPDVRIDRDSQTIEDAGSRRFEVSILDNEAILDDAGRDSDPQVNHVRARQSANHASADKFMTGNRFHRPPQRQGTSSGAFASISGTDARWSHGHVTTLIPLDPNDRLRVL